MASAATLDRRTADARVLRVNVSPGGVPKERVAEARVRALGLDGDGHRAHTVHGGPFRAVCLLGIEVIERLQAEGHPIFEGSTGENLTTVGIELADLPTGTRLAIGDEVLLEVTTPAMPCDTIVASFRDGKSGRLSILVHPHDSRMYARVLREGLVREGDRIVVRPPDPRSDAATQLALFRIESAVRNRHIALWRAAAAAGYPVEIVDDGELAVATSPPLPGPPFNLAFGLRSLPQFLPRVLERFARRGVTGSFAYPGRPWPGARVAETVVTLVAQPDGVDIGFEVAGVEVRETERLDGDAWASGPRGGSSDGSALADAWPAILRRLASDRSTHRFVAVERDAIVGSAFLFTHRRIGLLAGAVVAPDARGRGIQRALIAARGRRAIELGCDLLVLEATTDNRPSTTNAERAGFGEIARRDVYRFDPVTDGEAAISAARGAVGDRLPEPRLRTARVEPRPG